jgi:hypothetical protein
MFVLHIPMPATRHIPWVRPPPRNPGEIGAPLNPALAIGACAGSNDADDVTARITANRRVCGQLEWSGFVRSKGRQTNLPSHRSRMAAENQAIAAPYLDASGRNGQIRGMRGDQLPPGSNRGGVIIRLHILAHEDVALVIEHVSAIKRHNPQL